MSSHASDADQDPCVVCQIPKALTSLTSSNELHQQCPRCGEFKIADSAQSVLNRPQGKDKRAHLSGWIREQNRAGAIPTITSDNFSTILARRRPSVAERAFSLLDEAERGLSNLGDRFNINEPRFLAATYSVDQKDVTYLLSVLYEQGLAKSVALGGECEILPHGYMRLDEMRMRSSSSTQGFVAMWIDSALDEAYSVGFEVGIMNAGFNALRMDRHEHINRIDDEIMRQINASRFVVADFTGHRGGVYFEAGYALGIGLPVFWTCRKSDMGKLHFDIRQFNCIDWEDPNDLAERLAARIEAVLGRGPHSP